MSADVVLALQSFGFLTSDSAEMVMLLMMKILKLHDGFQDVFLYGHLVVSL